MICLCQIDPYTGNSIAVGLSYPNNMLERQKTGPIRFYSCCYIYIIHAKTCVNAIISIGAFTKANRYSAINMANSVIRINATYLSYTS
jgi:hypothetical protein